MMPHPLQMHLIMASVASLCLHRLRIVPSRGSLSRLHQFTIQEPLQLAIAIDRALTLLAVDLVVTPLAQTQRLTTVTQLQCIQIMQQTSSLPAIMAITVQERLPLP